MITPNITACIDALSGSEVSLDAHNKGGGNYKYASLPHLQRIVMPVVRQYGLVLVQTVVENNVEFRNIKVTKSTTSTPVDKTVCLACCVVETRLIDPENKDGVHVITTYGSKADVSSGDKSLGAFTTARRYGLATMFNLILSDDDGGDTDASPDPFAPTTAKTNNNLNSLLGL